jgi:hypothetical protein
MFIYAFNTYKAIGLLLPDLYYEYALSLLRTLWEVSLDLHWIAQDSEKRSLRFLNFTLLEYRKSLQRSVQKARKKNRHQEAGLLDKQVSELDRDAARFLKDYAVIDKRGRTHFVSEFSNKTPDAIARELGDDWIDEYARIYKLTYAYVHGAPGVIIFPLQFLDEEDELSTYEDQERTAKAAVWSIAIMAKTYTLFCRNIGLDESEYLDALSQRIPYRNAFRAL